MQIVSMMQTVVYYSGLKICIIFGKSVLFVSELLKLITLVFDIVCLIKLFLAQSYDQKCLFYFVLIDKGLVSLILDFISYQISTVEIIKKRKLICIQYATYWQINMMDSYLIISLVHYTYVLRSINIPYAPFFRSLNIASQPIYFCILLNVIEIQNKILVNICFSNTTQNQI